MKISKSTPFLFSFLFSCFAFLVSLVLQEQYGTSSFEFGINFKLSHCSH